MKYDLIIIGAGPAGLTAGIYASRRALKTLILSLDVGGQIINTPDIENYPALDLISGPDLASKMYQQAQKFGSEIKTGQEVNSIEKTEAGNFLVKCNGAEFESEAVVLAFGKTPRKLDVTDSDKYLGRGLSYCATCDGPFFKGKSVAVVGGGNSALDAALYLSSICEKVYLIHRRDQFRGEEIEAEKLKSKSNVEFVLNSVPSGLVGDEVLESVKVKDVNTGEEKEFLVSGIFVEIGYEVKADFVKNLVDIDDRNQIIIDQDGKTSCDGVFAGGDLTQTPYKQIVIAAGQGAVAALSAYDYIQKKLGKPAIRIDWGKQ
uniref:Thioredoxin reductase n=1 Tax=candidate division CPR3 bacterium TaxID=2268181 RepID=A0A7C4M149_UNCC3